MISEILKKWIAQSESWQTFIDFKLPEDSIARYPFLDRPDDFYISLFGSLYDALDNSDEESEKFLSIAKGLEIYSLGGKKNHFNGVDQANNILFASGLYYLAGYSSSAAILAKLFTVDTYESDIEKFLLSFLSRSAISNNSYRLLFDNYLRTGDLQSFDSLLYLLRKEKERSFKSDPYRFSLFYLAERIFIKFKNSNIWSDLLAINNNTEHWKEYIQKSTFRQFPIWDFFPSQKVALEKGILGEYRSMALQMPTSSGKTAICELLIYNEWKNNPNCKILYLAPFRALASELKHSFAKKLAGLGISSKTIYGGDIPTSEEKRAIQDISLLISTPEKFMAIENIEPNFASNFGVIICDEGHLLDAEGKRGLSYELLLSRLKKEGGKKFVFLSAIVPNIGDINTWLGGNTTGVVKSDYRATEIEYAFLVPSAGAGGKFELDVNPLYELPKRYVLYSFLTKDDFLYKEKLKTKVSERLDKSQKSKSAIIALKSLHSGSVALFSPAKGGGSGVMALSEELIDQIIKKPHLFAYLRDETHYRVLLREYFGIIFGAEYLLTKAVDFGFLFHHGDIPQYVREIIEDSIRGEQIKLIVCTNTLAEGVNLPIRTIVINSIKRSGQQKDDDVNLRDLKNLFGRVGRAGKETKGLVIITNPKDFTLVEKVIKEEGIQEVKGYLYKIIQETKKYLEITKKQLTNEDLERQDEPFRELIDSIDTSIIDLLSEDANAENLDEEIGSLISQTFANHLAGEGEKAILAKLMNLRGDRIRPYFFNGEFSSIKKSGSNLRIYEGLKDKLDIDNPIWISLDNPSDEVWLDFILKLVYELPTLKYQFERFNKESLKKEELYLKVEDVRRVMGAWIGGAWFGGISTFFLDNVDIALKFINSFIGYSLQSVISIVVHIVQLQLENKGEKISQVILDFPQYLIYGLGDRCQLDLMEIGFTDRIGIIELSKFLHESFTYETISELKNFLCENEGECLDSLKDKMPQISLKKMQDSFGFLKYDEIK